MFIFHLSNLLQFFFRVQNFRKLELNKPLSHEPCEAGDIFGDLVVYIELLLDGFNPIEKYDRQNGNFPQVGLNIKNIPNISKPPPRLSLVLVASAFMAL